MPDLTLYTFATSPYGLKVQAYLAYKRLSYSTVYADPFRLRQILPVGRTVPVLSIDGEHRSDSQDIASWLDERFPERPLFPRGDHETRIRAFDDWVQHCLITANFKFARPGMTAALPVQIANAWRLGAVMHQTIPGAIGWRRALWPLVLRNAPFIVREAARAPRGTLRDTARTVRRRLEAELSDGPFLCGRGAPSVADLSAYACITPGYELGLVGGGALLKRPKIRAWAERVHATLDPALPLVPPQVRQRAFTAPP